MDKRGNLYYPDGFSKGKLACKWGYKDEKGKTFYICYTKEQINSRLSKYSLFSPVIPLMMVGMGKKYHVRPDRDQIPNELSLIKKVEIKNKKGKRVLICLIFPLSATLLGEDVERRAEGLFKKLFVC